MDVVHYGGSADDAELQAWVDRQGYALAVRHADGRVSAVTRTVFNWRTLIGTLHSVDAAFCFHRLDGAVEAMMWEPPAGVHSREMDPPGGWHKSVMDGRRRYLPSDPPGHVLYDEKQRPIPRTPETTIDARWLT